jgi:cell division septation protein DedD
VQPQTPAEQQPPAPAEAAPAPSGGEWFAQIGAYRTRGAADDIVAKLKGAGFPTVVLPPTPGSPTATFRVRVGPYRDRREAESIAGRLLRELKFNSFVTR